MLRTEAGQQQPFKEHHYAEMMGAGELLALMLNRDYQIKIMDKCP